MRYIVNMKYYINTSFLTKIILIVLLTVRLDVILHKL